MGAKQLHRPEHASGQSGLRAAENSLIGTAHFPSATTNFCPGYPQGVGDCLEMRKDYTWDDASCTVAKAFVCELQYRKSRVMTTRTLVELGYFALPRINEHRCAEVAVVSLRASGAANRRRAINLGRGRQCVSRHTRSRARSSRARTWR
jgi:hypothetical protein